MTTTDMHISNQLPDPDRDAQFYTGLPVKRAIAWAMDFLVILLLTVILTTILGIFTLGFGFMLFPLVGIATSFFYRTLTITSRSSTWGMRLMGIEFRNRLGDRFDFTQAAVHTAIFMFLMGSLIGWILTAFCIAGTRFNQGIPDLILGSTAINTPID